MTNKIQKTTVKGILKRGDKILFVKDTKNIWELPGGKINFGETPEKTLKREFKEELGWNNVSVGKVINIWTFSSSAKNMKYHFIVLVYECSSWEEEIQPCDECTEYKWIPITEIDRLNIRNGYKRAVKEYLEAK